MTDHDLAALARDAKRERRLPARPTCSACGTTHHLSRGSDGQPLCYACRRREAGARDFEEDHVADRLNLGGLVVLFEPNAHRDVTDLRIQLGKDDWPAADGDPLLILAHFLCGLATLLVVIARWLLELSAHAAARLGPGAWAGAAVCPVVP